MRDELLGELFVLEATVRAMVSLCKSAPAARDALAEDLAHQVRAVVEQLAGLHQRLQVHTGEAPAVRPGRRRTTEGPRRGQGGRGPGHEQPSP